MISTVTEAYERVWVRSLSCRKGLERDLLLHQCLSEILKNRGKRVVSERGKSPVSPGTTAARHTPGRPYKEDEPGAECVCHREGYLQVTNHISLQGI